MATAIINTQMDAINESFSNISSDLTTIRPLLKNATIGAYPTDTASGSIANFTDGAEGIPVKSLSVDLEPIQDLNGYDNPWPAGGGKNILPHSGSTTTTNGITFTMNADGTVTASGTATAQATFTYNNSDFATPPTAGTYYFNGNPTGSSTSTYRMRIRRYVNGSWGSWVYYNVTNDAEYTITDGTTRMQVEIHVMSGQTVSNLVFSPMLRSTSYTDSTYAPYENICPISGHTEVNVVRSGANMLTMDASKWGLYATTPSGYQGNAARFAPYNQTIPFEVGKTYTINVYNGMGTNQSFYVGVGEYDSSNTRIVDHGWQAVPYTFTVQADTATIRMAFRKSSYVNCADCLAAVGTKLFITMTEEAAATYNVPLGQTVYGGTLDVVSGVLTVTHKKVEASEVNWAVSNSAQGVFYSTGINDFALGQTVGTNVYAKDAISNAYVFAGSGNYPTAFNLFYNTGYSGYRCFVADANMSGMDATQAKAYLTNLGVYFVYELATPTTVQLTPTQVSTLLGENNIFADAGTVSVLYRADVGLYIDKKLAQALNA